MNPTELFGNGYVADDKNITIPLSALKEVSAADANAKTGNGARVLCALMELVLQNYSAVGKRLDSVRVSKATPQIEGTDAIRVTYTSTFKQRIVSTEVVSES